MCSLSESSFKSALTSGKLTSVLRLRRAPKRYTENRRGSEELGHPPGRSWWSDVAAAGMVYERARARGLGMSLELA